MYFFKIKDIVITTHRKNFWGWNLSFKLSKQSFHVNSCIYVGFLQGLHNRKNMPVWAHNLFKHSKWSAFNRETIGAALTTFSDSLAWTHHQCCILESLGVSGFTIDTLIPVIHLRMTRPWCVSMWHHTAPNTLPVPIINWSCGRLWKDPNADTGMRFKDRKPLTDMEPENSPARGKNRVLWN